MATAPRGEIGRAQLEPFTKLVGPSAIPSWDSLVQVAEHVPDLVWPRSVMTYDAMMSDPQVGGLLRALTLPTKRFRWYIKPNGAQAGLVERLADDVGLPLEGEEEPSRLRNQNRFSWHDHISDALLALGYGHMYFEQVGEIEDSWWRLRKLGVRMPHTIQDIAVEKDGGLKFIQQLGASTKPIGVDRLVAYVWDKRGANWAGRPIIRELFQPWVAKDKLVRIDILKHERNGMGVPIAEMQEGAGPEAQAEAQKLAEGYRAGKYAGGTTPWGMKLRLMGVEGSLPDTLASIKYHDEVMARNLLLMVVQLGQTQTGSRALGSTFADLYALGLEAIAWWIVSTFNAHMIEDYTDWNVGESSPAPKLCFESIEDPSLAVEDLTSLVDSGVVTMDTETEAWVRERHQMPEADPATARSQGVPSTAEVPSPSVAARLNIAVDKRKIAQAAMPKVRRRQLYEHEVLAATDFDALDRAWEQKTGKMVETVLAHRRDQIEEIVEQVKGAKNLEELAALQATPRGAADLSVVLYETAIDGVSTALSEVMAQGQAIQAPEDFGQRLLVRRAQAVSSLVADGLSQAASAKALQVAKDKGDDLVADRVREHLEGLSESWLRDNLGGAVTAAQNAGRAAVFDEAKPDSLYASELLDINTCSNCSSIDGRQYASVEEAEQDYPTGGYHACSGGPRCRGTLVAVWNQDPAVPDPFNFDPAVI